MLLEHKVQYFTLLYQQSYNNPYLLLILLLLIL